MASKHKSKPQKAPVNQAESVRRLISRGQFKQALAEGKAAYRSQPTSELRQVLEQAYVARGRELARQTDQLPAARGVVDELVALKPTSAPVLVDLMRLLAAVGRLGEHVRVLEPVEAAVRDDLLPIVADAAVVHQVPPESVPQELRGDLSAVLQAIAHLEGGGEDEAVAALKEIPRQSLFAEWKLLVRGWVALRRGDAAEATACFGRLAPDRLTGRAAQILQRFLPGQRNSARPETRLDYAVEGLSRQLQDGSALLSLEQLRACVAEDDWREALAIVRRCNNQWKSIDPRLPQRISAILLHQALNSEDAERVDRLAECAAPLDIDPRWNRARALVREVDDFPIEDADRYWADYLLDLQNMAALTPEERRLGAALVEVHRGQEWVMCLVSYREDGFDIPATREKQAFSHFHNAQQLAPELIVAFESEIQAFRKLEDPKRAIAAGERLLERFPEHLPTLESLVRDCLEGDECLRGLEYARRAYRLKPLDAKTGTMAWAMHVGAARHCALRGDWEQGRRLFDEAEEFPHAPESANMFAARRAMFEQKAGEQEKAEAWLARAKEGWPDELPLKLILAVESRRYQMPPEVSALYMNAWRAALRQPKPSSFALGKVSEIMAAYAVYSVTENLVHQERDEVIDFLNKHKRKKLEPNDLRQVCHCLHVCEEEDLLESYVRKGRKAYPKHPYFAYLVGEMQMKLGPYEADRRLARREFQIALAGIEKSGDPRDKELLEPIRQSLHYLGDERHDDIPRGFSPATLFGAIERMCDQMGVDPEDLMHDLERAFEQTSKGRR